MFRAIMIVVGYVGVSAIWYRVGKKTGHYEGSCKVYDEVTKDLEDLIAKAEQRTQSEN